MSDDLVKKLRETTHMYQVDCELKMKCAGRIEELEDTIKKAMDVLRDAPDGNKWDEAYKAAEAVYEDTDLWNNLQTVVDALEELSDDE